MPAKKIILALLITAVSIGGFVTGLILLGQDQDVGRQAAVPGGQATVSISPSSGNYDVGDTIQTSVSFNTAGIAVSGVAVRLIYPFTGSSPEVTVEEIEINPSFTNSSDWTCPTKDASQQSGNVIIEVACANTSSSGFQTSADVLLATMTLSVERQPETVPFTIRFDDSLSIITQQSTGEDILLTPSSTGTYSIGGSGQATATPTITPTTGAGLSPTTTGSVTPTSSITATSTPTVVSTGSATPTGLPDSGIGDVTIWGAGLGVLLILASLVFAI